MEHPDRDRTDGMSEDEKRWEAESRFLRNSITRDQATHEAPVIACTMGFRMLRVLSTKELISLIDSQDTSDISKNNVDVFLRADLVMKATDEVGETCYAAVEVSYTVTGGDIRRAVFIAGLLSKFTGKRAYPAVAGPKLDDDARAVVEAGEVHWYEIESWR